MHTRTSRLRHVVLCALLSVAGITCMDSPSGPRRGHARVAFAPVFSREAAEIYKSLRAFDLEVDNIHLELEHANGETAKDTVVVVTAGTDSVVIEVSVPVDGTQETLEALVELRDGETVLFSGTQNITAVAGAPPTTPPPVDMVYTGPGATAVSMDAGPNVTMLTTQTLALQATFADAAGAPVSVSSDAVTWTSSAPTIATISSTNVLTPTGVRGTVTVTGEIPTGLEDSRTISIVPPVASIAVVTGAGQSGVVGQQLPNPIVVEVRAADGLPVPDVSVSFTPPSGGGVSPTSGVTDANGRVATVLTLGPAAGPQTLTSTTGAFSVGAGATANPGAAAKVAMVQQPSATTTSGAPLATQPVVRLLDQFNNAVFTANVTLIASLTSAEGRTLGGQTAVATDAEGVASYSNLSINGPAGTTTLTFSQEGLAGAVSGQITITSGAPVFLGAINASALSVTDTVGTGLATPLVPAVVVRDAGGNPVPGVTVKFRRHGGGSIDGLLPADTVVEKTTGADGNAGLTARRLPFATGLDTVLVSVEGINDTITFAASATHATAHHVSFATHPSTTTAATVFSPNVAVAVVDQFNNQVTTGSFATAPVSLEFAGEPPAGAGLSGQFQTAAAGLATFAASINKVGTYRLRARVDGLPLSSPSNEFMINTGAPTQMSTMAGDEQGALAGESLPTLLSVQLTDAGGNPVADQNVTFAVASGGGTVGTAQTEVVLATNSGGQATTSWKVGAVGSGTQIVTATHGGLSRQFRAYIAEKLVVIQQPTNNPQSGLGFTQKAQVQLQDAQNHLVPKAGALIKATFPPVDMNLQITSGAQTVSTDAQGIATFSTLTLEGDANVPFTMIFHNMLGGEPDGDVESTTSNSITLQPGLPIKLEISFPGKYQRVAPASTPNVAWVVSDKYNELPGVTVSFSSLHGSCGVPSVLTSNTNGVVEIQPTLTGVFTSCVIRGAIASPPAGHSPSDTLRLAIAPGISADAFRVWTGVENGEWTNPNNWHQGLVPGTNDRAFLPKMLAPNHKPGLSGNATVGDFVIEGGGELAINGKELYVGDTLFADGLISGGGVVRLGRPTTQIRGTIQALLKAGQTGCPSGYEYFVVGNLTVNGAEIHCALTVNENFLVQINGDLHTMPRPVDGNGGELKQQKGTIIVEGNAIFEGDIALFTDGLLDIKGNFFYQGDGTTQTFTASDPHVLRMSGKGTGDGLTFTQNGPANFATVQVQATENGIVRFVTDGEVGPQFGDLRVARSAHAIIGNNVFISLLHLFVEDASAAITFTMAPPGMTCANDRTLVQGTNVGPLQCTAPQ